MKYLVLRETTEYASHDSRVSRRGLDSVNSMPTITEDPEAWARENPTRECEWFVFVPIEDAVRIEVNSTRINRLEVQSVKRLDGLGQFLQRAMDDPDWGSR